MTEVSDPATAIARFLKDEIGSAVEERVFRPELPKDQDDLMPRACIVVFRGGGGHMKGQDRMEVFDSILDVVCYGSTRLEAENVGDKALYALRELGHKTVEGTLLHWARIAGSTKSAVDEQTLWPFSILTIQVLHSIP